MTASTPGVATPAQFKLTNTVAATLNNPRGLAFGAAGALYIAEAGAGAGAANAPCTSVPASICFGLTGSITRIDLVTGSSERIINGLPSLAAPDGSFAIGPSDISFTQNQAFVSIGSRFSALDRIAKFGLTAAGLGYLVQLQTSLRTWRYAVDLAGKSAAGGNPNSVLALPGKQLVIDAQANSLLEVRGVGSVRTFTEFPPLDVGGNTVDSVPTSIVPGPDGYYYAGELSGLAPGQVDGQLAAGSASVYRINPKSHALEVFRSGFTAIIDIAFLPDGSLCVLKIFNGDVVRVAPDGTRTTLATGLTNPGGMTVGPDGSIDVSNNAVQSGAGEIRKIIVP